MLFLTFDNNLIDLNKKKIFNDPVYGFITISSELIFDIIEHPYFQRLRRIRQLGLTDYVYPGALHTRFHHALGAMHLMGLALNNLKEKGHEISHEEYESAQIAILLHDIGHGPLSHVLEFDILDGVSHELISVILIDRLNTEFNGALGMALKMFQNEYERPFFHQLISSQLDIDRLDYLQRDCFFTGVSEGTIGADRIIKMLDVVDDKIVIEQKGIYSIENFLNARRLMYWQVYLHKTAVSAEKMISLIFRRAKELKQSGEEIWAPLAVQAFLETNVDKEKFLNESVYVDFFVQLDDFDIWACVKYWTSHQDTVLSQLCLKLLHRNLFKIKMSNFEFSPFTIEKLQGEIQDNYNLNQNESKYFYIDGRLTNSGYIARGQNINILSKNGSIKDVAEASDLPNITAISNIVTKYYLCYPKEIKLKEF